MMRLGGSVFGFSGTGGTSVSKGESLADTIRTTACYSDTIVIRSPHEGAACAASLYSEVPVINAGDGGHFHPTQTLTDLTTIAQKRGSLSNLRIGLCGDLKYGRTVHSLTEALSRFPGVSFYLISQPELRAPEYMKQGINYIEAESLSECIPELDILYMTRIQRERFEDSDEGEQLYERLKDIYVLTKDQLARARPDMLIMHPLPRCGEIAPEVDADPRAVYFEQARYGMYIRMALLLEFTRLPRIKPPPVEYALFECSNKNCVTTHEQCLPPLLSNSRCGYCDKPLHI